MIRHNVYYIILFRHIDHLLFGDRIQLSCVEFTLFICIEVYHFNIRRRHRVCEFDR